MSMSWSHMFAHGEAQSLPAGFEAYFGVGPLELVRDAHTVYMLCRTSTDTNRIVPLAKAIDPLINAGSWGGDLVIGFHAAAFDDYVARPGAFITH